MSIAVKIVGCLAKIKGEDWGHGRFAVSRGELAFEVSAHQLSEANACQAYRIGKTHAICAERPSATFFWGAWDNSRHLASSLQKKTEAPDWHFRFAC